MQEGGTAKLTIPADIAYGDGGSPPNIPGGATICFEVELLKVLTGGVGGLIGWVYSRAQNFQTGTSAGDRASVGVRSPRSPRRPRRRRRRRRHHQNPPRPGPGTRRSCSRARPCRIDATTFWSL